MEEPRGRLSSQELCDLDLPPGREQEILATNDQVDALVEVVDRHRELVGPLPVSVPRECVPGLFGGVLFDSAEAEVVEGNHHRVKEDPTRLLLFPACPPIPAGAGVAKLPVRRTKSRLDRGSRTPAGIDEARGGKTAKGLFVFVLAIALTDDGELRREPQPLQIFEEGRFELGSAADSIVVLDAKEDPAPERVGHTEDGESAGHVSEVQEARGGGGKPGRETRRRRLAQQRQGQRFTAMPITSNLAPNRSVPEPRKARAGNSFVK